MYKEKISENFSPSVTTPFLTAPTGVQNLTGVRPGVTGVHPGVTGVHPEVSGYTLRSLGCSRVTKNLVGCTPV